MLTMMHTARYHRNLWPSMWRVAAAVALAAAITSLACSPPGACSSTGVLSGQVINLSSGNIVVSALVVLQKGGLGSTASADGSKANTTYQIALPLDATGAFSGNLQCGKWGLHAYAQGFHAFAIDAVAGFPANLGLTTNNPNDVTPALLDVTLEPAAPQAGRRIKLSVNVQAASPKDALTDQVLLVNRTTAIVSALTPPSAAAIAGVFPNGLWSVEFTAPRQSGIYVYELVAVTASGVTTSQPLRLNVQP